MARPSVLFIVALGSALILAGAAQSRQHETTPVLTGTVGPAFTITLVGSDGQPVTTLVEGTYTINISDKSNQHDFHLFGPGINQSTGVTDVVDATWTVTLQPGGYAFVCDPHVGAGMRATFSVVRAMQLAAPLTKKQVAGTTPRTRASGSFVATVARNSSGGATLNWNLAFANLTGPATAVHVHLGMPGRSGATVVTLCTSCQSGSKGSVEVPASALQALLSGRTYVDVHTTKYPDGEIRGQLAVQGV